MAKRRTYTVIMHRQFALIFLKKEATELFPFQISITVFGKGSGLN